MTTRVFKPSTSPLRRVAYTVVLLACWAAAARAQELVVNELWRTKGDLQTVLFASVSDLAEAPDGSIWVADARNSMVLSIDTFLAIHVIAREGKGPGEVIESSRIARMPSGNMAVYGGVYIHLFGPDGQFIRRILLEASVRNSKGFAVLPDGDFILSGGIPGGTAVPGGEYAIHIFGPDGELEASWWPIPETRNPRGGVYVAGGPVDALPDGSILFSDAAPHQIIHFSSDGSERELIASDPDLLEPEAGTFIHVTGSGASRVTRFDWHFPQAGLVERLSTGRILNVVEDQDGGRTLFQLYSSEGESLAQTWVDTGYGAMSVTRDGDILAEWIDPDTYEQYAVRLELEYRP